jgi:uncharacterized membrane protein YbhN (UPF0104 family)
MRRLPAFAAKAAVSALLLYFAVTSVNFSTIGDRLKELNIAWMLGAVALVCMQIVMLSIRWQQIARACDAPLSPARAFRFNLIATFFNQVLPSSVGGDAARIWLLARDGAGWTKAFHSVLLDRFVGVLALALLVVFCLPWTLERIQSPVGRSALLVIGVGSVCGAAVFLLLGHLKWGWLARWMPTRHLTEMARTARSFLFTARTGAPIIALSFAIHALTAATAWFAAYAIDATFSFFDALQLVLPVMLITTIPISVAGWGVREKSLVLAFAYAGLAETDGFLVSVLLGVAMFVVGGIGGIVWLAGSDRIAAAATATEP